MAKFLKKHLTTFILNLFLLIGLCLLLYPSVADWWNSFHQTKAIASYVEAVEDMSGEELERMLEEARDYNRRLSLKGIHFLLSEEEQAEYESILDITGTGIMGYIQIQKINVNLPIYHGTSEEVLQVAAGHLEGTSFPVGGGDTHSAISGHRGLPSARLFTDLDQLVEGDIFTVTVLNETVTYQVDQIRIVLPEEVSELQIVSGEDYCTLITCTPYGINSHRMLIRGTRIENIKNALALNAEAVRIPPVIVIPAVGIPILFVLLVILLIYYRYKKPPKTEEELYRELKESSRRVRRKGP